MKIFNIIWKTIVILGVLVGIIDGYDATLDFFNSLYNFFTPSTLLYIKALTQIFVFLLSLVFYIINRTKLIVFFKSKVFQPIFVVKELHEFQHIYDEFIDKIDSKQKAGEDIKLGDSFCRNNIFELLSQIRITLSTIGLDQTSVNIKIPINTGNGGNSIMDLDHAELKTYERAPSPLEEKLTSTEDGDSLPKLKERSNKERFIISNEENAVEWIEKHQGDCNKGHLRCNSTYIRVLGSGEHAWISNDLIKAKKKNQFSSSSAGWSKYYKSLAVVAIAPHQKKFNGCIDNSFGILIADSPKKNAFNKRLVRRVMGYYAHRLYKLLIYIEFRI